MRLRRLRLIPMAAAAGAMVLGLWTGLYRLGLPLPALADLAPWHGALMIFGFLGTLISLERAVALQAAWGYAAPALSACGLIALLLGQPRLAALSALAASMVLVAASLALLRRHVSLAAFGLIVAALCWTIGAAEWLAGSATARVAAWGVLFLVLTVAAERLEMGRLIEVPRAAQTVFAGLVLIALAGAALGELAAGAAPRLGVGLLGLSLWLLRYDIARRTVRHGGQARFAGLCMLAGHVWLAIAGVLLLAMQPDNAAWLYDAALHAVTIGFVLSMIFGHAPIVLPAITGARLPYTPALYLPLVILHGSAVLRVGADLLQSFEARSASGVLTVTALAFYAGLAGASAAGFLPARAAA